ncbi:hypothetical protein VNI00_012388 [Paramarasmius palmivorus]|uniref:MARVEL domain-containing protein n=1 Tax=Paramarasmius palmivorus TaxID=297713 RepID=A0AAW0C7R1_9AGAR
MPLIRTIRTILYGKPSASQKGFEGLCQTGLAIFTALYAWPPTRSLTESPENRETRHYLPYFSVVGAILACLTWTWTSVLLSYNNKPVSDHKLAFALPHFVSFAAMAALWFAVAIMHLTNTRHTCENGMGPEGTYWTWCGMDASMGGVSLALFLLASGAAFWIHRTAQKSGTLQSKLLEHDGDLSHYMPSRTGVKTESMSPTTKVRTTLYSLLVAFGVCEMGLAIVTAIGGAWTPVWIVFSSLAILVALLTWISASVLLSFNHRPYMTRTLTKASTHFYILVTVHVCWLVVMIMLFTQTRANCPEVEDPDRGMSACPIFIPVSVVAVVLWVLSGVTAAYIHAKNKSGGKLSAHNIAGDEDTDLNRSLTRNTKA